MQNLRYCTRLYLLFFGLLLASPLLGQTNPAAVTASYFEKIRNNEAQLTAFFNTMPKGGDLHHHFSGSVFGETYLAYIASQNDLWINIKTLKIEEEKPKGLSNTQMANWKTVATLKKERHFGDISKELLRRWSVMDYDASRPPHEQFFESFDYFGIASRPTISEGLFRMKHRAKLENVQYIETQFKAVKLRGYDISSFKKYDQLLLDAQANQDEKATQKLLKSFEKELDKTKITPIVTDYNQWITNLHDSLALDDEDFSIRYQAFVKRYQNPSKLFAHMVANFMAADQSKLVVGVNILAPEHGTVSMRDYWLHMQMFKFCHQLFPDVRYSLHAGELTTNLVKPEDLTWHISSAVYTAGAHRIGHGVDIAHEKNVYLLLRNMQELGTAVEINLSSNEFILEVKDDAHPINLYHSFQVPIVISTDDAGVLRNNLTSQFVLLAKRYPQFSYETIKAFVYNSIAYSFAEKSKKKKMKALLDKKFELFEKTIMLHAVHDVHIPNKK